MIEHDIIQLMGLDHPTTRVVTSEYFNPEHGLTERELVAHRQLKADQRILAAQITAAAALKIPLIYAVIRSEVPDVVKIGYSQHLTARLRKMPGSRLVAVQLGGRDVERAIHERLACARVRLPLPGGGATEHFTLTPEVTEWINDTRRAIGLRTLDNAQ